MTIQISKTCSKYYRRSNAINHVFSIKSMVDGLRACHYSITFRWQISLPVFLSTGKQLSQGEGEKHSTYWKSFHIVQPVTKSTLATSCRILGIKKYGGSWTTVVALEQSISEALVSGSSGQPGYCREDVKTLGSANQSLIIQVLYLFVQRLLQLSTEVPKMM